MWVMHVASMCEIYRTASVDRTARYCLAMGAVLICQCLGVVISGRVRDCGHRGCRDLSLLF